MKVTLLVVGTTDKKYLKEGVEDYFKRIGFYLPFQTKIVPDIKNNKNLTSFQQKEKEGKALLEQISATDEVVLLDENGEMYSSVAFASWIEKRIGGGAKQLIFVIGGPYGFSEAIYLRANKKISISPMTFSHQMVRLIFAEQLYRALTIIKGEPYHHV